MKKTLCYCIIGLWGVLSIYLLVELQSVHSRLNQHLAASEQHLAEARDACEARVAQIRYEYEQRLAEAKQRPAGGKLAEIIGLVESRRQQTREELFTRLVVALNLDENTLEDFKAAIEAHEQKKQALLQQIKLEVGSLQAPMYLEQANANRQQTLNVIRQILTDEQYDTFLQLGFDGNFDLRLR